MADFEVHIDLDGRTRPIGLARSNRVRGAETILFEYEDTWLKEVATVTATWRDTAKTVGSRSSEINRMASAFEHDDLKRALAL